MAILDFILDHTRRFGYPPSLREIGDAVNLKTSSAVSYQVGALEAMGYLTRQPGRPRSFVVTSLYQPAHSGPPVGRAGEWDGDFVSVPLVGRIAAGGPILAFDDREDDLPLPRWLVGYGDDFALRVSGDSMIGAGINDGDLTVIRKQPGVMSGEKAAAMIRNRTTGDFEATVKEYRVYGGHAWLVPHNPAYSAYQITPGDKMIILGKVTAVVRRGL